VRVAAFAAAGDDDEAEGVVGRRKFRTKVPHSGAIRQRQIKAIQLVAGPPSLLSCWQEECR
jgi:hypothetical protein